MELKLPSVIASNQGEARSQDKVTSNHTCSKARVVVELYSQCRHTHPSIFPFLSCSSCLSTVHSFFSFRNTTYVRPRRQASCRKTILNCYKMHYGSLTSASSHFTHRYDVQDIPRRHSPRGVPRHVSRCAWRRALVYHQQCNLPGVRLLLRFASIPAQCLHDSPDSWPIILRLASPAYSANGTRTIPSLTPPTLTLRATSTAHPLGQVSNLPLCQVSIYLLLEVSLRSHDPRVAGSSVLAQWK